MGNICSSLCDNSIFQREPKKQFNGKDKSMIQLEIQQAIQRLSATHFKRKRSTQSLEKPSRSTENIKKLYIFEHQLGQGNFGQVRKAKLRIDPNRVFAVKSIEKKSHRSEIDLFLKELEFMKVFDHPNIVKFYEVYEDVKEIHLVQEYCQGGELLDKLLDQNNRIYPQQGKEILWQILLAVNYMHQRKIAHRDLKPDNFLFKNDQVNTLKLIDFGLSQTFCNRQLKTIAGSPYYVAPEVIDAKYNEKCDLWSVGVILYLIITGDFPFQGETNFDIFHQITKGDYDRQLARSQEELWGHEAIDLMEGLLIKDPEGRPSAFEALNHSFFFNIRAQHISSGRKLLDKKMLNNLKTFTYSSVFQREMMGLMIQAFDDEEETYKLKQVFNYIDDDHSGTIQLEEIAGLFKEFDIYVNQEQVEEIVDSLYLKEKGIITFLEFIAGAIEKKYFVDKQRMTAFFNYLDTDGSGLICINDIQRCFRRFGRRLSKTKVRAMIFEVDLNGDEEISFDEFEEIMTKLVSTKITQVADIIDLK